MATSCGSDDLAPAESAGDGTEAPDGSDAGQSPDGTNTDGTNGDGDGDGDEVQVGPRRARLQAFDACDAFLDHVRAEAGARVGAYGFNSGGFGGPIGIFVDDIAREVEEAAMDESASDAAFDTAGDVATTAVASESAPAAQSARLGGVEFSETNNQVVGVDEPDIIKTDGNRIITVTNQTLRVYAVDGPNATETGRLELQVWPRDILFSGDRILVFGDDWGAPVAELAASSGDAESSFAGDREFGPTFGPVTTVTQVDISGAPTTLATLRLEGSNVSARAIDGIARIVVSSPPPELSFLFPQDQRTEDLAKETNQRIVAESRLEDWLSEYALTRADGTVVTGPIAPCEQIYRPNEFAGFGLLSVLTVDMNGDLTPGSGSAVVAEGQNVYASNSNLYVATNRWAGDLVEAGTEPAPDVWDDYTTELHQFDITDPTAARYVASGTAPGSLLNQFALHEWEGRLHVATTEGAPWGFSEESESLITVLEPQGDNLVQVGQVGNMGRGERIFAVRYIGATAYVVTFRQTDPLYVVDLRDPTNPVVTGELKIPGYSAYLHPIGEGRLVGVGQEATEEGRSIGAKVSLFDVNDPTNPVELSTWIETDGYSGAEWDHRAFLWWGPRNLAVLPLTSWQDGFSGAIALEITADGITERARFDHAVETTGDVVVSPCRQLEPEDNFFGPGATVELCGEDQFADRPGFYCERLPAEEATEIARFEFGLDVEIQPNERLSICWPDDGGFPPNIMRTLVIGDSLWSLSHKALQSNSLDDFSRTGRADF